MRLGGRRRQGGSFIAPAERGGTRRVRPGSAEPGADCARCTRRSVGRWVTREVSPESWPRKGMSVAATHDHQLP